MHRSLKIFVVILSVFQSNMLFAEDIIKFGIMELYSNGTCTFLEESTVIPLKLKDTGFRWGYTIESSKKKFTTYSLCYSPKPFTEITGTLTREKNAPDVLKSQTVNVTKGIHVECFWNDASDPTGRQKIDIYVNNTIAKSIDFEVVEIKE